MYFIISKHSNVRDRKLNDVSADVKLAFFEKI